jgi:hypothetical protein
VFHIEAFKLSVRLIASDPEGVNTFIPGRPRSAHHAHLQKEPVWGMAAAKGIYMDDTIKIVAGVLAGVVGLVSLGLNRYQYVAARRRESLAEIIQGEKETAAAAAIRIGSQTRAPHLEELQALCLAAVFERSGRTRSLIHGALKGQPKEHHNQIRQIVDQITVVIARNASYTDLKRARRRLISLRSVLSLDGDTRTRIDAIERYTSAVRMDAETPCGCGHEAHQWGQLRQTLSLLGTLVLVCRTQDKDTPLQSDRVLSVPIIALDYHRTTAGDLSQAASRLWTASTPKIECLPISG